MPINALIFDFDGLILDTETPEYLAWSEIYADFGCELPLDLWVDAIGRGHEQVTFRPYDFLRERSPGDFEEEYIQTRRRARFLELVQTQPPRAGVVSYLEEAKRRGLKLAVASSSARIWVEGHLSRLGLLDYFDLTRCSDDVTCTKPDPELYLSAVSGLGVTPEATIAFEDSINGATAASRAGLYTVAVPNALTAPLSFDMVHRRIESMGDVPLADILAVAEEKHVRISHHPLPR